MAIQVLIDDKHRHRGDTYVSINPKLNRLLLYKRAYEDMKKAYGKDIDHVLVLWDDERPHLFWIQPCDADVQGARKLDTPSENTRTLSIRMLLQKLGWKKDRGTVRLPLDWDKDQKAAIIDTSKAEEAPGSGRKKSK
jgi:hypothetical protein